MLTILLLACIDNSIENNSDKVVEPEDTAVDCPPAIPDCNDTDEPVDSDSPVEDTDPGDCDVRAESPVEVGVLEECEGTGGVGTITDPFDLVIEYQYTSTGQGAIVMPAIGNMTDDNGDGKVDENDIPDIAFTEWSSNNLVLLSGDGSGEIFTVSGYNGQGGVSIADVDADGEPEIVAFTTSGAIAAVNASGVAEWTSSTFPVMSYPQPAVADLDADGKPEVIGDVGVVNGEDGSTVATLTGITNSWRTPVAADLDQDGDQEIILGNQVYDKNGTKIWSNSGTGSGNFNAVANIDSDNEAEVFFVSGSTMYVHEHDGTLIGSYSIPGTNPGPPSIADFDGDGDIEIAIPANTQISVFEVDGTKIWQSTINDSSGLAGCSGYDMDGDGAYEVLYADQDALRMYDGATGAILYEDFSHSSGTVWEYPVIADIDKDDSAEICIASNGSTWRGVTCFGHDGDGWPKSGPTWGTHDFAVTNLEADGHVPQNPDASWLEHNVFRARPAVDDPSFPDVSGKLIETCAVCPADLAKMSIQVQNKGADDIEAGTPWALWANDAGTYTLVTTGTLDAIPSGYANASFEIEVAASSLGANGFAIELDYGDTLGECDEDNNWIEYPDGFCQ